MNVMQTKFLLLVTSVLRLRFAQHLPLSRQSLEQLLPTLLSNSSWSPIHSQQVHTFLYRSIAPSRARVVDGQYVLRVAEHKTALTYGRAKIVLAPVQTGAKTILAEREQSSVLAAKTLAETLSGLNSTPQTEASAAATAADVAAATATETHTRHDWDTTSLSALCNVFGADIAEGTVSLETVRSKIVDNELLTNIGSRKVYDRIRNEIRKTYGKSKTSLLPTECETVAERVQRLLPNEQQLSAQSEDSDSEYVAPSTSNHIFTEKDVCTVTKLCMHIISLGPVSEMRINEELSKSSAGRSLLEKFTLHQLKNRV